MDISFLHTQKKTKTAVFALMRIRLWLLSASTDSGGVLVYAFLADDL
jgi:hypothetical protein